MTCHFLIKPRGVIPTKIKCQGFREVYEATMKLIWGFFFSPASFVRTQKDVLHVDLGIENQQSEGRAAVWFDPLIYRHATSESSSLQFEVCGQQQKKEGGIKEAGRNNKQNKRNVNTLLSVPSCVGNDYVHMCVSGEKRNHHQLFDFFFLCRQLVWLLSGLLCHSDAQDVAKDGEIAWMTDVSASRSSSHRAIRYWNRLRGSSVNTE